MKDISGWIRWMAVWVGMQQNCRICSLSHFGLFRYPAGHYLCWLLMFPRANVGTQNHQDTKMWLSVTCQRRGCLHRDYIPEESLAKRSLPLSELIGIRGSFAGRNMQCTCKAQSWEKKPSFFNVKLMKKHHRCCPRWIGTKCNVITSCHVQTMRKKKKKYVTEMETRQRKQPEVCLQLPHSGLWVHQQLEGGQLFLDAQQNLCERMDNTNK